jgi:hypothetical protein
METLHYFALSERSVLAAGGGTSREKQHLFCIAGLIFSSTEGKIVTTAATQARFGLKFDYQNSAFAS